MEIKPTKEHLSDPYVLQLIEALSKQDDEIERLQARVMELERVGKELLDATVEATLDRYARVPRGDIRDLEKALQETEE